MADQDTRDDDIRDDVVDDATDDERDDEAATTEDAEGTDGKSDEDDPEKLKAELNKLRRAYDKLQRENKRRRLAAKGVDADGGTGKSAEPAQTPPPAAVTSTDDAAKSDLRLIRETEQLRGEIQKLRERNEKLQDQTVRSKAMSALMDAEADKDTLKRWRSQGIDFTRLAGGIEVDGDEITNLDDWIDDLKDGFPELFRKPEPPTKRPAPRIAAGDRQPPDRDHRSGVSETTRKMLAASR